MRKRLMAAQKREKQGGPGGLNTYGPAYAVQGDGRL